MSAITLHGNKMNTLKNLPEVGGTAPGFNLVNGDLATVSLDDFKGSKVILNIFPSVDTGTCAASVRKFNEAAAALENTKVLCISRDLPFAQARFCGAEGLNNVVSLSDFRDQSFGKDYGVELVDGPLQGLLSRAVVVLDENQKLRYTEQVSEVSEEPNYKAALEALQD
ncbi:thiol peroxidase [Galbibacter sp.]|jgi:thiol peroxidase|uniref:thiol peroxidase n=1 Tax=Galbibacter sp. TaxID=2918471 RepID=UPI003A93299C